MRIWSLHPEYLDTRGLLALWREALLAKYVLEGKTKGYRNHPQLSRFKDTADPVKSIYQYLSHVYIESQKRGYKFNNTKIDWNFKPVIMTVTDGQMKFEVLHLKNKLKTRAPEKYKELSGIKKIKPHPMFQIIDGEIEKWEKK